MNFYWHSNQSFIVLQISNCAFAYTSVALNRTFGITDMFFSLHQREKDELFGILFRLIKNSKRFISTFVQ